MKKNLFYYLFAVICSVSLFTSCSDDDDEKVVCPVGETTFTDKSGLQLTYSSAPMLGKMVQFVPQGNKAVLTLSGAPLDLWLSGNFWLVSFKISYLCLPLFYETRTTPSCHPSGCAYRQL